MNITIPEKLPGKSAHLTMAPFHRIDSLKFEVNPPKEAIRSSVLILLIPSEFGLETVLIKRNIYNGIHSGQISFPGGKCDKEDSDITETACREAYEELGIRTQDYKIIGHLSRLYVPPSNYLIYPVLAISDKRPDYKPDPREVSEFIHVPISKFNPANSQICKVEAGPSLTVEAPAYVVEGHVIWGATAMILAELYQVAAAADKISRINP